MGIASLKWFSSSTYCTRFTQASPIQRSAPKIPQDLYNGRISMVNFKSIPLHITIQNDNVRFVCRLKVYTPCIYLNSRLTGTLHYHIISIHVQIVIHTNKSKTCRVLKICLKIRSLRTIISYYFLLFLGEYLFSK